MIESNSPLLRAATKALNEFKAMNPGVRACISGGFLRDVCVGQTPRDCDVFVEMPKDADAAFERTLHDAFGLVGWYMEVTPEYHACPGVARIGRAGYVSEDPLVEINVILLNHGVDPVADAKGHDFGACQVWTEGGEIHATSAFFNDVAQRTFTLDVCEDQEQFDRSMRRWERLSPRFPGWTLSIPARFSHFATANMRDL